MLCGAAPKRGGCISVRRGRKGRERTLRLGISLTHAFHLQFFFSYLDDFCVARRHLDVVGRFSHPRGLEALPYIIHQAGARVGKPRAMGMHVPHVEKLSYPNASGTLAARYDFPCRGQSSCKLTSSVSSSDI